MLIEEARELYLILRHSPQVPTLHAPAALSENNLKRLNILSASDTAENDRLFFQNKRKRISHTCGLF